MSQRALAAIAPLLLVALTASACRLIVGITDLSVDGGVDATFDGMHADVGSGGADANADVGEDRGSPDAASDAGADRQDVGSGPPVNCDAQPPSEASAGRIGCIEGCLEGHPGSSDEFYDEARICICGTNCKSVCPGFCDKACLVTTPTGACNDCASHVIVDEGGACHKQWDDAGCIGCQSFAACVAQCPAQ
jgi:hypothetical protein